MIPQSPSDTRIWSVTRDNGHISHLVSLLQLDDLQTSEDAYTALRQSIHSGGETVTRHTLAALIEVVMEQGETPRVMQLIMSTRHPEFIFDCLVAHTSTATSIMTVVDILTRLCESPQNLMANFVQHQVFVELINATHKASSDVLVSVLLLLTSALPHCRCMNITRLNDFFNLMWRSASMLHDKDNFHLRRTLFLFIKPIYGLYPCNTLTFLRSLLCHNRQPINEKVYHKVVQPMISRLKLHGDLLLKSKESELRMSRFNRSTVHELAHLCDGLECTVNLSDEAEDFDDNDSVIEMIGESSSHFAVDQQSSLLSAGSSSLLHSPSALTTNEPRQPKQPSLSRRSSLTSSLSGVKKWFKGTSVTSEVIPIIEPEDESVDEAHDALEDIATPPFRHKQIGLLHLKLPPKLETPPLEQTTAHRPRFTSECKPIAPFGRSLLNRQWSSCNNIVEAIEPLSADAVRHTRTTISNTESTSVVDDMRRACQDYMTANAMREFDRVVDDNLPINEQLNMLKNEVNVLQRMVVFERQSCRLQVQRCRQMFKRMKNSYRKYWQQAGEINQLRKINREYENETAELHDELVRLRQLNDEAIQRREDDLATLRQKANLMQEEFGLARSAVEKYKDECTRLHRTCRELKDSADTLSQKATENQMAAQVATIKAKRATFKAQDRDHLEAELTRMHIDLTAANCAVKRNRNLEKQMTDMRREHERLIENHCKITQEYDMMDKHNKAKCAIVEAKLEASEFTVHRQSELIATLRHDMTSVLLTHEQRLQAAQLKYTTLLSVCERQEMHVIEVNAALEVNAGSPVDVPPLNRVGAIVEIPPSIGGSNYRTHFHHSNDDVSMSL